ncbi:MAG: hypothetical protein ACOCZ8_02825 [Bacteroidota bacterium]
MHIQVKTRVPGHYQTVFEHFNQELFEFVMPGFPKAELERYDGPTPGDRFELTLFTPFGKQYWHGLITERLMTEHYAYFIDVGEKLPFFLKDWHHTHWVIPDGETHSYIIDDFKFKAPFALLTPFVGLALWLQFRGRRPGYRKYFKQLAEQGRVAV